MDTSIRTFLKPVDYATRLKIVNDYLALEKTGTTGNTTLRRTAREYLDFLGTHSDSQITIMMDCIAKECFRYFGEKYIEEMNRPAQVGT